MKDIPYGYTWMPAAHDSYPGWDHVYFKEGMPSVPFKEKRTPRGFFQRYADMSMFAHVDTLEKVPNLDGYDSLFCRKDLERQHLTHIMFNAMDAPKTTNNASYAKRIRYKKAFKIFQDSGGFQLVSGAKEFVDPNLVAERHLEYAHEGVGLDIPAGSLIDLDYLKAAGDIQIKNNKMIHKLLGGSVDLFVTSHGVSAQGRAEYLDQILDSPFEGMCIAGLRPVLGIYAPSLEEQILHLIYTIGRTRKLVTRYHILGVSSYPTMMMLGAVAEHYKLRITSDSSRHIMTGAGGRTLTYPGLKAEESTAGSRARGGVVGIKGNLNLSACTCGICSRIHLDFPWSDTRFLQTHAFSSLVLSGTMARTQGPFLLAHPSPSFSLPKNFPSVMKMLKEITDPQDALKELARIQRRTHGAGKTTSLFPKAEVEGVTKPTNKLLAQMWQVIERYKLFHRKNK